MVVFSLLLALTLLADTPVERYRPTPEALRQAYARADGLGARLTNRVFKAQISPHWFADGSGFWYRNDLRAGAREFILVDAHRGTRQPAFDHARLAAALTKASGTVHAADRLPFHRIEFQDGGRTVQFDVLGDTWRCDVTSYQVTRVPGAKPPTQAAPLAAAAEELFPEEPFPNADAPQVKKARPAPATAAEGARSPDGTWSAFVRDCNVSLHHRASGLETRLSTAGTADCAFGMLSWSPDSRTLAACRVTPGDQKPVHLLESSPQEGGRAKLRSTAYLLPGDRYPVHELWLFDVASWRATKVNADPVDYGYGMPLRWGRDGRTVRFEQTDRGHQRFRVFEVEVATGTVRTLLDERAKTFVNRYNHYLHHAANGREMIWASERDGWRHLYLIDAREPNVLRPITRGPWVVRGVDLVDEAKRQIWFRASGKHAGQDPYLIHHYRVNFDGTGLVALTAGDGNHTVQFSPDRRYLIDTFSRVDQPPVHDLRRAEDGSLVCELEQADVRALRETGWQAPEVFCAKGRDGSTDIWGMVVRPRQLDSGKKYPVIEYIYAGPHNSHVPKSFATGFRNMGALAELGFVVVQIDGMGTANRSKAFHDVCWHNLADAGFPDRIAWMKALAAHYPYLDLERVGIYGGSAGGQSSTGALLFHPDFYHVAVSSCGCHDNRMDKAIWNEQWMGYPVGPHYAAQSNVTNAASLRGKLLLLVGELDTNVPPESTLRLADALIKAGKEFELLVMPGVGHSDGGTYGERKRRDFFVRHLHGVAPPEWNHSERPSR